MWEVKSKKAKVKNRREKFKMRNGWLSIVFVLTAAVAAFAQSSVFTYQGKLNESGTPASATYDMQFKLFDASSAGNQIGVTQTKTNVTTTAGIFTVSLDFGAAAFDGADKWLEISISPAGQNNYTTLAPRQKLDSAPYSIRASNATTATNSLQLGGVAANQYVRTNDARLSDARMPLPGSSNYIQNSDTPQLGVNFNVTGTGTANVLNAAQQFNLGGNRILSSAGLNNLFAGVNAGASNAGGASNSFFGRGAGSGNISGNFNSFFGDLAGSNTLANGNSFFGKDAGSTNVSGSNNTFIGNSANFNTANPTGINNTLLGAFTQVNSGVSFSTAIGEGAQVTQSNSLVLGRLNVNVGIGTTAPAAKLHIKGVVEGIRLQGSVPGNANLAYITFLDSNGTEIGYVGDGSEGDKNVFLTSATGSVEFVTQAGRIFTGTPTGNILMAGGPNVLGASVNTYAAQTIDTGNFRGLFTPNLFLSGIDTFLASPIHICARIQTIGGTGGYALVRCTGSFASERNKSDAQPFLSGLNVIKRLNPVAFKWKENGTSDVGLNAEDVAEVAPQLVTRNAQGEIEDVKENGLSVVLINAIKEQQTQIEAQKNLIETQREQLEKQQQQIDALVKVVCAANRAAEICREK